MRIKNFSCIIIFFFDNLNGKDKFDFVFCELGKSRDKWCLESFVAKRSSMHWKNIIEEWFGVSENETARTKTNETN